MGEGFHGRLRQSHPNRVQITTDGHKAYLKAVEGAFGADIDYAMLHKIYGAPMNEHAIPLQCASAAT